MERDDVAARFEQIVDLDVSLESAWNAISNPDELARWLGASVDIDVAPGGRGRIVDDDGTIRDVVVTDVRESEHIAWHWWSEHGELSSVELRLDEHDGFTRLRIVETALLPAAQSDRGRAHLVGCSRRWSAATSHLWHRVGTASFA